MNAVATILPAPVPAPFPGQRLVTRGGLGIEVHDVFADGRVYLRTDIHPVQAMEPGHFAAWTRCLGARTAEGSAS